MPVTKAELLTLLKDPQIANALRSMAIQNASSMTVGRFPGQGSAENDNWPYRDACDATHPFNADYVLPKNFQRIIAAKLSFILRPYRTYSTLTLTNTGNDNADHTHTGGTTGTESATHTHAIVVTGTGATVLIGVDGTFSNWLDNGTGGGTTPPTNTESATHSHSGGTSSGRSSVHQHSVSGTTTLGIAEDSAPVNPGITIAFDGTDKTAALGGPFNASMVELDVTQFLPTATGIQHTVSLQPNQRATITAMLRISYAVDARLAQ